MVAYCCGWTLLAVTAEAGACWGGAARYVPPRATWASFDPDVPFLMWPAAARWSLESDALITMAGAVASEGWRPGRVREPLAAQAAERVEAMAEQEAAAVPAELRERAAQVVSEEDAEDDETHLARLMRSAHGEDVASAAGHLAFLDAQCRRIVQAEWKRISMLARSLEISGSLTGEVVAALLR